MLRNNFACKTKRKWQKDDETESSSHKYVNSNKITRQTYIKQNKLKTAKTNERRDKTTPTKKSKSIINDVTALFSCSFFLLLCEAQAEASQLDVLVLPHLIYKILTRSRIYIYQITLHTHTACAKSLYLL